MQKGLVLPVDIRDKVLGALGQIQDGLKVDNFRTGRLDGGVLPRQQAQIAQFLGSEGIFQLHGMPPLGC